MEKQEPLVDNMIVATQKYLDEMLDWIAEKYGETCFTKKLYILHMINPNLFGNSWMGDTY